MPSSAKGIPKQITTAAATAVAGGVLLAGKNSGLFVTTSKIGCPIAMATRASNAAPRSSVTSWRFQPRTARAGDLRRIDSNATTSAGAATITYTTTAANSDAANRSHADGEKNTLYPPALVGRTAAITRSPQRR